MAEAKAERMSGASAPAESVLGPVIAASVAEAERVVAWLRLVAIPIFAVAETLPHPDPERAAFDIVLGLFALFAVGAVVWTSRGSPGQIFGITATGIDIAAVATLAALSGGAFSPARSAFLVLPVVVALRFNPRLTAVASVSTLLAYLVQALVHPSSGVPNAGTEIAVRGSFLVWIGISATVLSTLLERRTKSVSELSSARRRLESRYRDLFHGVPIGLFRLDEHGRLLDANRALLELLGVSGGTLRPGPDAPGLPFPDGDRDRWRGLAEEERLRGVEFVSTGADGEPRWLRTSGRAVRDESGSTIGYEGSLEDVSEWRRVEQELAVRLRQQAAVAELAQASMVAHDQERFFARAVAVVAETLEVEYSKVLELRAGEPDLLLRTGVGWLDGAVGTARVSAARDSQAGFTLLSREPVVTEDLETETRFRTPDLLVDHGIRSGVSVAIGDPEAPFGVLGAHSRAPRRFSADDVHFLRVVAGLLASVVERASAEAALRDSRARFIASRQRLLADALAAEERERQLLAESLHDQAIQTVLAARQDVLEAAAGDGAALERAAAALAETVRDLREAIFELDPRVYVQAGFEAALRAAAVRAGRRGGFDVRIDVCRGPLPHERLLLSAGRQLLANVATHAEARRVAVRLARRGDAVVLTVADDGRGFDPDELAGKVAAGHIGLASHRERAESAGGTFRVRSAPGRGTAISLRLPLA